MDKIRVLLVEDEPTLAMIIKDTLDGEEFEVILAANGEEGLSRYREAKPDIIVTDIMMPRIDGFTMVRHIRKTDRQIPVLFLSARSAANDAVEGFELGGNDYLKKPFGMAELIIRIKALLNKISVRKEESSNFMLGQYTFDSITQTLQYCGEKQLLSNRESEILKRLCENKDHVLPMKDVLLELWGDDSFFNARSLHVFITKLRHKLSKDESIKILNVRGIGYKLIIDTFQTPDCLADFHSDQQFGQTLCISLATTNDLYIFNYVVLRVDNHHFRTYPTSRSISNTLSIHPFLLPL